MVHHQRFGIIPGQKLGAFPTIIPTYLAQSSIQAHPFQLIYLPAIWTNNPHSRFRPSDFNRQFGRGRVRFRSENFQLLLHDFLLFGRSRLSRPSHRVRFGRF